MRGHDLHRELDSNHSIIQERLKRERPQREEAATEPKWQQRGAALRTVSRSKSTICREKGAYSDSNQTALCQHSDFDSCVQKLGNVETMSGIILNRWQPKFASKLVASEMHCLKAQWRLDEEPVSALTRAPLYCCAERSLAESEI